MSKTENNLKTAFAGESQANRKYLAFAKIAEGEGKMGLAKIFKAAAEGETVHALNHLKISGEVKDSDENLKAAISGETYEIEVMYPQFIDEANDEGDARAGMVFGGALNVEKVHQKLFQEAISKLEAGKDIADADYYVCQVCGNPVSPEAPDVCPICRSPKEMFKKI